MAKYILKNKDIDVLSFETTIKGKQSKYEVGTRQILQNITILHSNLLPLNLKFNDFQKSSEEILLKWIEKRKAPNNRQFIEKIIATYSNDWQEMPMDYIDVSLGLSLNDSFWIVPANENYKWKDYNLYDNAFNETLERIAFGDTTQKISGITSSPEYTTNGMLKKCWHRIDKQIYLYKGSSTEYANGGKEAFSEFYMAQIAEIMQFEYVPYDLKAFHNQMVSSCPIFTNENEGYIPIYYLLNKELIKNKKENKEEFINAINKIYGRANLHDLMLFDALIYNTDRHLGNFGMIIDNNTNELLRPAPIFDNGLSIFNNPTKDDLKDIRLYMKQFVSYYDYNFDEQLKIFVEKRHIPNLEKLTQFKFKRHKEFNLSDEWLEPIEKHIQERAKFAIELCKAKELDKIAQKHADLAKEIQNYTEHKSVFYPNARKRIEDKIISLCVDLNTSGEIINPKDFEVFLNIVKERNNSRSL